MLINGYGRSLSSSPPPSPLLNHLAPLYPFVPKKKDPLAYVSQTPSLRGWRAEPKRAAPSCMHVGQPPSAPLLLSWWRLFCVVHALMTLMLSCQDWAQTRFLSAYPPTLYPCNLPFFFILSFLLTFFRHFFFSPSISLSLFGCFGIVSFKLRSKIIYIFFFKYIWFKIFY